MIDVSTRALLRQRALTAWERSKRLRPDTEALHLQARETLKYVQERRARRAADRYSTHLEVLVDRAIRWSRQNPAAATGLRGLAASINLPRLVQLEEAMRNWTPFLVGAGDAGTALGLAIATQPDVAIIDDRLDIATGADLILTLPTYAPETTALLLTDDADAATDVRLAGFDMQARDFSEPALSSWIASVAS